MGSGMLELCESVCGVLCVLQPTRTNKETRIANGFGEEITLLQFEASPSLKQ